MFKTEWNSCPWRLVLVIVQGRWLHIVVMPVLLPFTPRAHFRVRVGLTWSLPLAQVVDRAFVSAKNTGDGMSFVQECKENGPNWVVESSATA